jgi:transcriptional regulator GlxA family with amidase domain
MSDSSPTRPRLVQIVLFDGFDPLDVIAPYEVLWAGAMATKGALQVELASLEGAREVPSGSALALRATAVLDPERVGILVVPGAVGTVSGDGDDTIPAILGRTASSALAAAIGRALGRPEALVATVCGGSLVLAMGGLIEGRHAVTHPLGMDVLAAAGVNAVRARVVDDGNLVSAGGVTSGLDLGLYLLERELGPRVAHEVELLFAYERRGTTWRRTGLDAVYP